MANQRRRSSQSMRSPQALESRCRDAKIGDMGNDFERGSGIELLHEAEQRRTREFATQAAAEFIDSVLAIYRSNDANERRPEHIGSCLLLDIDGTPVVATAAHIVDNIPQAATLFVASPARPQLVPIVGGNIKAPAATSKSPTRGRVKIPHLAVTGRAMITRFDEPWQDAQRIL